MFSSSSWSCSSTSQCRPSRRFLFRQRPTARCPPRALRPRPKNNSHFSASTGVAEVDEDRTVRFLRGIALDRAFPHQGTFLQSGNGRHHAVAFDLDAVIPAGDAVAEVPAERQARAAVRAAVLERAEGAVLVAPQ